MEPVYFRFEPNRRDVPTKVLFSYLVAPCMSLHPYLSFVCVCPTSISPTRSLYFSLHAPLALPLRAVPNRNHPGPRLNVYHK